MAISKVFFEKLYTILTLLTMGFCFSWLLMDLMALGAVIPYPKKIPKIHRSRDKPAGISIFSRKISKFCYTKKYIYRLHLNT